MVVVRSECSVSQCWLWERVRKAERKDEGGTGRAGLYEKVGGERDRDAGLAGGGGLASAERRHWRATAARP